MMRKTDNAIYSFLIIISAFLMISRYMVYIIGALFLLFLYYAQRRRSFRKEKINRLFITMVVVIGLEFVQIFGSRLFSAEEGITEIQRVIIYYLLLNIASSMTIELNAYIRIWRFFVIVIVGVAVLQFTKIINIDSYLINIYGYSVQFHNSAQTLLSLFRAGSIFINPNVFANFLVAYLGSYLILKDYSTEREGAKVFTYIVIAIGLVLSGSRTGLVIGITEIALYFFLVSKQSKKRFFSGGVSQIITLIIAGVIIYGIISSVAGSDIGELRFLKVGEGRSNSLDQKLDNFKYVMSLGDFTNYLFGFGPFDYSRDPRLLIDFELGYFIAFYGIVGVGLYIGLLRSLLQYKTHNRGENTDYYLLQINKNKLFALVVFMFGFSSGVFFNLRLFSVLLVMCSVSFIICEDSQNEKVYTI